MVSSARRFSVLASLVCGPLLLPACSCDGDLAPPPDLGVDAGMDAGQDLGVDLGQDLGQDLGVDLGQDLGVDLGQDLGVDLGVDAGPRLITCAADLPNDCASAGTRKLTLALGESGTMGGVVDTRGDDYFTVEFTGVGGVNDVFRPRIEFLTNPGDQYVFSVETACGSSFASCGTELTTWEASYPGYLGVCGQTGSPCTDQVPRPTQIIVHVKRVNLPQNCFQYLIRVSNPT